MCEKFFDWCHTIGLLIFSRKRHGGEFEKFFHIAHEQIIFVSVVNVEGRPAYFRPSEHILYGDALEWPFLNQRDKSIAKRIARAQDTAINLFRLRDGVRGH